jgi:hypothetical protein
MGQARYVNLLFNLMAQGNAGSILFCALLYLLRVVQMAQKVCADVDGTHPRAVAFLAVVVTAASFSRFPCVVLHLFACPASIKTLCVRSLLPFPCKTPI